MRSSTASTTATAMTATNSTNTVVPMAPSRLPFAHQVQRHHRGGEPGRGAGREVDLAGEQHEHQAHRDDRLAGALLEQVGQVEQAGEGAARVERGEQDEQREQAEQRGQRAEVAVAQVGAGRRGSPRRWSSRWCRCRSRPPAPTREPPARRRSRRRPSSSTWGSSVCVFVSRPSDAHALGPLQAEVARPARGDQLDDLAVGDVLGRHLRDHPAQVQAWRCGRRPRRRRPCCG